MAAAQGGADWHSKGILLTLLDTSASGENTGKTWMHRLRDEWMQKCMDGLAEDEGEQMHDQLKQWSQNWMGRS